MITTLRGPYLMESLTIPLAWKMPLICLEFSEEEMRNAINDLGKEKAPAQMGLILPIFSVVGMLSRGT